MDLKISIGTFVAVGVIFAVGLLRSDEPGNGRARVLPKVWIIGDSIAAGCFSDRAFPRSLQAALGDIAEVRVNARWGRKMIYASSVLTSLLDAGELGEADVVVIALGTNDRRNKENLGKVVEAARAAQDLLGGRGIHSVFLMIGRSPAAAAFWRGQLQSGALLVVPKLPAQLWHDETHPNTVGHRVIAATLEPVVRQALAE